MGRENDRDEDEVFEIDEEETEEEDFLVVENREERINGVYLPDRYFIADSRVFPEEATTLIVFIHGFGDHSGRFLFIKKYFSEECAFYSYDARGIGRSEQGESDIGVSPNQHAEDLKYLLRNRIEFNRFEKVFLLAHGFGCHISFLLDIYNNGLKKVIPNLEGMMLVSPCPTVGVARTKSSVWKLMVKLFSFVYPNLPLFRPLDLAKKAGMSYNEKKRIREIKQKHRSRKVDLFRRRYNSKNESEMGRFAANSSFGNFRNIGDFRIAFRDEDEGEEKRKEIDDDEGEKIPNMKFYGREKERDDSFKERWFFSKKDIDWKLSNYRTELESDPLIFRGYLTAKVCSLLLDSSDFLLSNLKKVSSPCIFVCSKDDVVVQADNVRKIYNDIGSKEKCVFLLEHGGHDLLNEKSVQEIICQRLLKWTKMSIKSSSNE